MEYSHFHSILKAHLYFQNNKVRCFILLYILFKKIMFIINNTYFQQKKRKKRRIVTYKSFNGIEIFFF